MKTIFGALLLSLITINMAFATAVRGIPRYDRQVTLTSTSGDGNDLIILLKDNRVIFFSNSTMNGLKLIGPAQGTDLQSLAKKSEALAIRNGKVSARELAKYAGIGGATGAGLGFFGMGLAGLLGNTLIIASAGSIQPEAVAGGVIGVCMAAGAAIGAFEGYSEKRCYRKLAHALGDLNDKTSKKKDTKIWMYGGDPVNAATELLKN